MAYGMSHLDNCQRTTGTGAMHPYTSLTVASAAVELKKANAAQELECGNGQVGVGPGTYGAGNFSVKLNEALDESNPDPCATLIGPSRLTTLLWDIVGWPATWKYRNSLVLYRFKWYNETDYTRPVLLLLSVALRYRVVACCWEKQNSAQDGNCDQPGVGIYLDWAFVGMSYND
eukprot:jgi/Chrzof1/5114/Cz15g11270.t1